MTIEVSSSVKPPRKRDKIPRHIRDAAKKYKDAYAAVYGLRPTVTYEPATGWFTLLGVSSRVKLKRLKELTAQLRRRIR